VPFLSATVQASAEFTPASLARAFPVQGSWLLLVTDGVNRPALVSPGVFSGFSDAHCGPFLRQQLQTTIPLTPATIGAGVFDLAGNLQGIVAQCDDSISILGIGDIQRALTDANAATLLVRYGMRLSPTPSSPAATANAPKNILVGELWTGWPADAAGMEAGDALLSINGQNVATIDQTVAALSTQNLASYRLRVRRSQRTFFVDLKPVQLASTDASQPSALELEPSGMRLLHVAPGSSAATAGIRNDDIILRIADLPATPARVNQLLGSYRVSAPVSAVIWRPGRELLVWIQP
jgi:serine protease Do